MISEEKKMKSRRSRLAMPTRVSSILSTDQIKKSSSKQKQWLTRHYSLLNIH